MCDLNENFSKLNQIVEKISHNFRNTEDIANYGKQQKQQIRENLLTNCYE